jgi:SAM-dependent methyltransferase
LISKYVPKFKNTEAKICEIGSGDGQLLKKFAQFLGCQPFGVEYSKEAAKQAKKNGVETIVTDAFDKNFLKKYQNYFDVVFSYGFIEHITPPERAVQIHLQLLKPGGYVIIQIPRFRGFNMLKLKILRPDFISLHNIEIMDEGMLEKICKSSQVKKLFCKNYGTFKLRFPMEKKNMKFYLLQIICLNEYLLNPLFRIIFKDRGFETYFFSPAVMFIGRKNETTS